MSNLDLLNDLDIVLLAAGKPDLKTIAAQGDERSPYVSRRAKLLNTKSLEKVFVDDE